MLLSNYNLTPLFPSKSREELRNNGRYNYNTQHLYNNLVSKPLDIPISICFSPGEINKQSEYHFSQFRWTNRYIESKLLALENLVNNCHMLIITQVSNSGVNIPSGTLVKFKSITIVMNLILNWEMCKLTSEKESSWPINCLSSWNPGSHSLYQSASSIFVWVCL